MKKLVVLSVIFLLSAFALSALAQSGGRAAARGTWEGNSGWDGGGYNGYGYGDGCGGYGYYTSGVKLDLKLIPKGEREAVKNGIVSVDGGEAGIVDSFDGAWNGAVPICPGSHQVLVELEDGRQFQTTVVVHPGRIVKVFIRFKKN